ncbi:hypothetical protein ILP92_13025 [Maribius pontilimi]|uniref:Uncharacterized protein n=1 Tax=Palleronia pontilimi TaxID=1964209 RepID=A0A934IAU2_9RHOB|nr:hypothetical protein [Palleronia pontilimi]MBJ3763673.1 hypothetical protein [Palleronia pontilimi]
MTHSTDAASLPDLAASLPSGPAAILEVLKARGRISAEQVSLLQAMMSGDTPPPDAPGAPSDPGADSETQIPSHAADLLERADLRIGWLETVLAHVAQGLGACPRCLGGDPACPDCDGDGLPGSRPPHREAFDYFVLPVLDRLKRPRRRPTDAQAPSAIGRMSVAATRSQVD